MKYLLTLALAGLLVVPVRAADESKKPAATFEVEVVQDVAYNEDKDADKERHVLDLYLPKGAKDYPVLFFIHGGGWRNGSKKGSGAHGKAFARQGIGFVTINYRLSPKVQHPAHIQDVAKAFAWVSKNIGKRGGRADCIFVSGHSAGGHLCALLAVDDTYIKAEKASAASIKGVLPISGVFNVNHARMEKLFGDEDSRKKASPMTHVKEKLPPFLLLYADKELGALGKQAQLFGAALKKVKCDCEVKEIKDRDHGSIMRRASSPDDEVFKAIAAFIAKHSSAAKAKAASE
jgi:acetyl esterase/lipase